jgi:CMP-N-acetylneuraminic acid synthetase/spore coat polysaccharide biosynthesis predicted glycosyltransferase SpsG
MHAIVIIPARGGSKGIPRKCLRPVAGKPMIFYAINTAQHCSKVSRVVVSTDDEEIALIARRFGAEVIARPDELANDQATLDPVIAHAAIACETQFSESYEVIVTVQPTSPLVRVSNIEKAIELLESGDNDTVVSVVDDRHLCWTVVNGTATPSYEARANRQALPPRFRETGAVVACRRQQLLQGTRFGARVALLELPLVCSFDVDSFEDISLCESVMKRKRVVLAVIGYPEVGLGHVYRALMVANELVHHELVFVCEQTSQLAAEMIQKRNFRVVIAPDGALLETILREEPDLVINDVLDTDASYIRALKDRGCRVLNFEDLGSGIKEADLVINAMYPSTVPYPQVLAGHDYFMLRDEFMYPPTGEVHDNVKRVLVTFGGVDEGNLAMRVIGLIAPLAIARGIGVDVVLGPGNHNKTQILQASTQWPADAVNVVETTSRISDYMARADFAITAGGRTVLELAALRVPTMVLCQNAREATHTFASGNLGVINLGLHSNVSDAEITRVFREIVDGQTLRDFMCERMSLIDLRKGRVRVMEAIAGLLQ